MFGLQLFALFFSYWFSIISFVFIIIGLVAGSLVNPHFITSFLIALSIAILLFGIIMALSYRG